MDQPAYNHWGCGRRIQFLIEYNRKNTRDCGDQKVYLKPNNGFIRLNKLVEYWNYQGNKNPIWKTVIFTPIKLREIMI